MNRQEAIEWLKSIRRTAIFEQVEAMDMAIEALESKRPQGEWIEHKYAEEYDGLIQSNFECNKCHDWLREKTDYCPSCGANMRGKK